MDVLELGHRLYACLDAQDWTAIERLAHPRLLVQVDSAPPMGLDDWHRGQGTFHAGSPDGHHVIEESLVSGNHVVTRCRYVGTHRGVFAGVTPTGNAVSVRAIHIDRFEEDLLVEHRGQLDMLGLLTQIGALPTG